MTFLGEFPKASQKPNLRPRHQECQMGFWKDEVIIFFKFDAIPIVLPHLDAIVIKMIVTNQEVRKVYVDNGIAFNILCLDCFKKLGIKKDKLLPCSSLQSFVQVKVQP